jgi:hypothetical protein
MVGQIRPEAYPIMRHTLPVPLDIKAGWKGFLMTDALAYLASFSMTKKKKSNDFDTRGQCYKTFLSVIYDFLY